MKDITLDQLIEGARKQGAQVFEKGDYNLNTIGIRSIDNDMSGDSVNNKFNDLVCVFYKVNGEWNLYKYKATTVPGKDYMLNPFNANFGTAVLVPGFYSGVYVLGYHYGKPALQQVGNLKLYRDKTKDLALDLDPASIQEVNWSGINIHYSYDNASEVGKWSAGCQVLGYGPQSPKYSEFLNHFRNAIKAGWKNRFSYGLVLENDI